MPGLDPEGPPPQDNEMSSSQNPRAKFQEDKTPLHIIEHEERPTIPILDREFLQLANFWSAMNYLKCLHVNF